MKTKKTKKTTAIIKPTKALTKRKRGRKSAWDTKIEPKLNLIKHWCRKGYTDLQMCDALGISTACFFKYKAIKKELVDAIRVNKEIADLTVENSLFVRANGYEYEETTTEYEFDADGNKKEVKSKTVKKQKSPNVTAQIYWLNNRTAEWADRQVLSHEGGVTNNTNVEHTITIDESPGAVAEVLGILLQAGAIQERLIKSGGAEPKLIEGSHT